MSAVLGQAISPDELDRARALAASVTDPELPVLTLADLGVLRDVHAEDGTVVATITPTYSGCPAMAAMRDDLLRTLTTAGFDDVEVRVRLQPAWSTDWISDEGRESLRRNGISPPGSAPRHVVGAIPLQLGPTRRTLACPRCGSSATRLVSEFGATACKSLHRCEACLEPFEHVKEI